MLIREHMRTPGINTAIGFLLLIAPVYSGLAQSRDVPFTLEDRDRIIQIEEKINSQQIQINDVKTELSDMKQEVKDIKQEILNLFYWGFGSMMSFMLFLLGFIIWDRRTTVDPIRERTQLLMQTLREYAKEQPKLADILRSHGLM